MRNKMVKKTLAGTLAATMVLGTGMTAFAQTGDATGTGTGTGTGSFEGHVDKEIIAVTLPTSTATTFSYKMDPEGLIAATNKAKYSDSTFEEGASVYFLSDDNTYTKDSAKLKVVNKGTVPVDVTVVAKTDANSNIAMSTSKEFAESDTDAKLYLGLQVANQPEVAIDTTETAGKVTVGLKGNDANYEITSTDGGYGYTAKTGVPDSAWNSFEFGLTGACNQNGDYSADSLAASNVTVTWSYAVREDETNPMVPENAVDGPIVAVSTSGLITVNGLTSEKNYKSITITDGDGKSLALSIAPVTWNTDNWSAVDGGSFSVQLGDQWITYLNQKGGTAVVTVTLSDGSTITANATLTQ